MSCVPTNTHGRGEEMAESKKRARKDDGTFQKDDPSTPDVNEAFEQPGVENSEPKPEYVKTRKFKKVELKFTAQGRYADGRKVPWKNMKVMKALQVDPDGLITGNVVQLPWEATVNNGVAGAPEDQIGLKKYERKGFIFCVEADGTPMFSTLWDDWSEYDAEYEAKVRHRNQGESGKFGQNATTSKTMSGV